MNFICLLYLVNDKEIMCTTLLQKYKFKTVTVGQTDF